MEPTLEAPLNGEAAAPARFLFTALGVGMKPKNVIALYLAAFISTIPPRVPVADLTVAR